MAQFAMTTENAGHLLGLWLVSQLRHSDIGPSVCGRSEVSQWAVRTRGAPGPHASLDPKGVRLGAWISRANQHAAPGTAERVFAALYQSILRMPTSRSETSQLVRQAVEDAGRLGDDRVLMGAAGYAVLSLRALPDIDLVGMGVARALISITLVESASTRTASAARGWFSLPRAGC